jgi:ADP-ribose pyrophosphatase
MNRALFFYGTLCHIPLLEIVLGRSGAEIDISEALLPDHLVSWVKDEPFPMIAAHPRGRARGILVQDLSPQDVDRLRFYEGGFEYDLASVAVELSAGRNAQAEVFFPEVGVWSAGAEWVLDDWIAEWGRVSEAAAREVMEHYGKRSVDEVARLLPFFRARGWAKQLAQETAPTSLRRDTSSADVTLKPTGDGFAEFFRLDTFELSYPRFDGTQSETLQRSAFVAYDAALVLPYDPKNDLVMLIEQLRYGPLMRGDPKPWVLEPIAGLVDAGEPPIEAARREAVEEAGIDLRDIRPMMKVYPSPGYSTEFFHCFLGICALDLAMEGTHGLASENEDIRTHVISFDRAMVLVDSGEINLAPLTMMLLWIARHGESLRANA